MIRPLVDDVIALVIPWNTPGSTPRGTELYAPGSFHARDFVGLPLMYRHGEPVGFVRDAWEHPDGIVIAARFATTERAREVAQLVDDRAVGGVSAGFTERLPARRSADGTRVVVVAGLPHEVSITPTPAYRAARVLGIRPGAEPTATEVAA